MNYLYNLDLDASEISQLVNSNNSVNDMSEEDIVEYISILVDAGCSQGQIHKIITANPYYFSKNTNVVRHLLRRLMSFDGIDVPRMLENYPLILNKNVNELDNYINEYAGLSLEEILVKFISG